MATELVHLRNYEPLNTRYDLHGGRRSKPTSARDFVAHVWNGRRMSFPPPNGEAVAPVLSVIVEQGRWIVLCPFCSGAELADPDDPRFYCLTCYCAPVGNKWLLVQWPAARAGIEAALLVRPEANQNWLPGETVADLLAENREAGL